MNEVTEDADLVGVTGAELISPRGFSMGALSIGRLPVEILSEGNAADRLGGEDERRLLGRNAAGIDDGLQ